MQFERFCDELESRLAMIIGSQGVPLTYVIRENEDAIFRDDVPYGEAAILAVPLSGTKFELDSRTVHQLILKNVHDE